MAKCHITGILELPSSPTSTPVPAASAVFRILSGISDTEILVNTAQDIPVGADGSVSFYATQGATLWIYSNAKGFDDDIENGTPFFIPETATAQVMGLQANVSLPTQVPVAVGSITIEVDTGGQYFDVTDSIDELPGADPTGVADSTAAILRTITVATVAGGVLYFPEGNFLVSGVGSEIFLITRGLVIRGAGRMNSIIKVAASVGSSTDIFRFFPDTNPHGRGFEFSDIGFEPVSGNPGRYAINLDGSVEAIYSFTVARCWSGELGNYFVAMTNTVPALDGVFTGVVADNVVVKFVGLGGISIRNGGDSIQILRNTLLVEGHSIDAEFQSDIGGTKIQDNNLTGTQGVRVRGGRGTVIADNNIELVSTDTGSNGAALDLDGTATNILQGPQIHGNSFNIRPTPGSEIHGVRLQYCQGAHFYGNEVVIGAGKYAVQVKNTSTGTIIGLGNHIRDVNLAETKLQTYVNEGDLTLVDMQSVGDAWTVYTPTLSAATGTFDSASAAGRWKRTGKTVQVRASATISTNGSAAVGVRMSLPVPALDAFHSFVGRENGITGKSVNAAIYPDTSTIHITFYDGTYPGADGHLVNIIGMYEAA